MPLASGSIRAKPGRPPEGDGNSARRNPGPLFHSNPETPPGTDSKIQVATDTNPTIFINNYAEDCEQGNARGRLARVKNLLPNSSTHTPPPFENRVATLDISVIIK